MEYYAATKRNEILPFAITGMELDGIMLSKISQSEKDNYHKVSLIRGVEETMQRTTGKGREKQNGRNPERETNHERFLIIGKNLRVAGGEVGGGMG